MLAEISSRELSEWQAEYSISPFGEERADLRAGIIASVIANVNRDPKKGKAFKPSDFMPLVEEEKAEQSPEVQMGIVETMAAAVRARKER